MVSRAKDTGAKLDLAPVIASLTDPNIDALYVTQYALFTTLYVDHFG